MAGKPRRCRLRRLGFGGICIRSIFFCISTSLTPFQSKPPVFYPTTFIMMFTSVIATLVAFAIPALAQTTVSVSYDTSYDNGAASLSTVACSDGVYGLETEGYTTFSSLPDFPYIGGAPAITGWDSPSCGTCWELNYSAGSINETIYVTAMDVGQDGFNLSLEAMNALTNNLAQQLGRISATATLVSNSSCGF